jgi:hypothetical protein
MSNMASARVINPWTWATSSGSFRRWRLTKLDEVLTRQVAIHV